MALLQGLLAVIFRSAGKLLNTAFGWATVMLFGRVPQDRQIYLSLISFGSVIWLLTLVGIAFPAVATFLLSFVPLPKSVDRKWIRLAMLVAAVLVPAVVGLLAVRMLDPAKRPRGAAGITKTILRGYPYTVGLALTLVLMTVFAPILKLRDLARRWTTGHVPVIVEPEDYASVVDDVQQALRESGIDTARGRASVMLRLPTRILGGFAGSAVGSFVARTLTRLYADGVEILLHPSDMVISGSPALVSRARAALSERLTFTAAYLTWDKEANEIEDALRRVWRGVKDGAGEAALTRLSELEERMHRLTLPYEEWEVLFRQKLQVERAALRSLDGLPDHASTRPAAELDTGLVNRAILAAAGAAVELRKAWHAEAAGHGVGLVPMLTALAALGAALVRRDRQAPTGAPRLTRVPASDARGEPRLPRAA